MSVAMSFSDGIISLVPRLSPLSAFLSHKLVLAERSDYIAIITEAKSMYVMIKSILRFDDVGDVSSLL